MLFCPLAFPHPSHVLRPLASILALGFRALGLPHVKAEVVFCYSPMHSLEAVSLSLPRQPSWINSLFLTSPEKCSGAETWGRQAAALNSQEESR